MAITINGNGTLTGVSVGGLPDGIVDTDMLAASAVTAAKSSGLGITHANIYRLHTSFTHNGTHTVLTNWEEADDASSGKLGSGWSLPSSGVFSFPATGIYRVKVQYRVRSTGENGWPGCDIKVTQNNGGAYDLVSDTFQGISDLSTSSSYSSGTTEAIVDCTDTGQVKFQVTAYGDSGSGITDAVFEATTSSNATIVSIIRLGDT